MTRTLGRTVAIASHGLTVLSGMIWSLCGQSLCVNKAVTTSSGTKRRWHICDHMSSVPAKAHAKGLLPATADKQADQQQGEMRMLLVSPDHAGEIQK